MICAWRSAAVTVGRPLSWLSLTTCELTVGSTPEFGSKSWNRIEIVPWFRPAALDGLGDAALAAAAKAIAYRLDPQAVVDRAAKAETERTVTMRPAPDTMTYLTALLPVAQGVSVYAALKPAAVSISFWTTTVSSLRGCRLH